VKKEPGLENSANLPEKPLLVVQTFQVQRWTNPVPQTTSKTGSVNFKRFKKVNFKTF